MQQQYFPFLCFQKARQFIPDRRGDGKIKVRKRKTSDFELLICHAAVSLPANWFHRRLMRRRKGEEASSREQVKGLTPAALSAETNEEEKVATNGFSAPTVSELQSTYKTSARLSERQRGNLLSSSNQSTAEH